MPNSPNRSEVLYDQAFHADRDVSTREAAHTILSMVFEWCSIGSVCDVGCGVGTWLAVARELGASTVAGFEGPWGESSLLQVENELVQFGDLEKPVTADRRFDLAISLEVAEHLTHERSSGFVRDLCRLSDLVLFSAAIPDQGGTGHINERWQSHWANLFAAQGYATFDAVRPRIWGQESVPWWYRQNVLLYAQRDSLVAKELAQVTPEMGFCLDMVHPELFSLAERSQPWRALKRTARKILRR